MYETGEYIHYGSTGLCRVEEITTLGSSDDERERLYYRLIPMSGQNGVIYTPVDNQKVPMRRALGRAEAEDLIADMPRIELLAIPAGKHAEDAYKAALSSTDCHVWVALIKTLNTRRARRAEQGRRPTSTEERYFREAHERLNTELANAVGIRPGEVDDFIEEKLSAQPV